MGNRGICWTEDKDLGIHFTLMYHLIDSQSESLQDIVHIFQFNEFTTESNFDWVRIYEGWEVSASQQLLEWSGTEAPPVVKSGTNRILVTFTSDYARQYTGFAAEWKAGRVDLRGKTLNPDTLHFDWYIWLNILRFRCRPLWGRSQCHLILAGHHITELSISVPRLHRVHMELE